jgi:photosystem II stability/assembly factor-like uncharacterized protein
LKEKTSARMKHLILLSCLLIGFVSLGQKKKKDQSTEPKTPLEQLAINGLKFRSVGPAITSGRISDFAINPDNPKEYYVATSSGGAWKTINGGTTYKPIFDGQGSYSIGVVTMDPNNPNVIWVGTGENNNQRSVAYGDGIYKSEDAGASWKHMGLKNSEHIGSIIVDPEDSDRIYVAAQGPLWRAGGDRGLYVSEDGGETWKATLTVDEHTGVNEVVMHPSNPKILYASTHQRRRHVFTYISGGPGSSVYRSTDKGQTWTEIKKGLPGVEMGRVGLAIAPSDPETVYAVVEAAQGKGGFYRTTNRGASWEKRSGYSSSGNYYQEIVVDPIDPNTVYAMNTWLQISKDAGKTFKVLGEDYKHVDNHCMWIDPTDTEHFLVGCDGGIYESYDGAATWHFKPNLPVTQFYKVALDNDEPFYNIYGGTQDNFSMGGPSRSISNNGIPNSDWYMTNGGDGFESQVDPSNPDIVYAQSQYGFLIRYDRKNGEGVGIKPQPGKDEKAYRWNWDAPLHISAHKPERIYFSANKVFRSDNRGNSWEVISDDLTQQINRNELEVMGKVWGIDAVMKNGSTSPYGTIVAFHESPLNENLLIAGTDDGLIQITTDGGQNWRKVSSFPGVPNRTYVNFVLASQHDEKVIYAAFNNHKNGDFKPYIYKSSDQGNTWQQLNNNLPERGSTYSIAEDHQSPDLLFVGTEYGVFFSPNQGMEWKQLKNGLPTIAIRDIAIQTREDDLVLASFGRGFYVLDDFSSLRSISSEMKKDAALFSVRDPWLYVESLPLGLPGKAFLGDSYYQGENLGPVAMFTYYIDDAPKSYKDLRQEMEKKSDHNAYPSYQELKDERMEIAPYLIFTMTNSDGEIVRKITTKPSKGLNRITWDLRYGHDDPISLRAPSFYNPFAGKSEGPLVAPGNYTVSMSIYEKGNFTSLGEEVSFEVKALNMAVLAASDRDAKLDFQRKVTLLSGEVSAVQRRISELDNQLRHVEKAILLTETEQKTLFGEYEQILTDLINLKYELNYDPVAATLDIDQSPTIGNRMGLLAYEQLNTTSEPTQTHQAVYQIIKEEFEPYKKTFSEMLKRFDALQDRLVEAGAPYTPYSFKD